MYIERDGGDWYVVDGDRRVADLHTQSRAVARQLKDMLSTGHLPKGWTVERAKGLGPRIDYLLSSSGDRKATIWEIGRTVFAEVAA